MIDKLLSLRSKLQAFRCLPQSEYRAIGEHLLPEVLSTIDELDTYKESLEREYKQKYFDAVVNSYEKELQTVVEYMGYRYKMIVSREVIL